MRWPFKEWGAHAVLAGHAHHYERLHVNGLPYFVNGLGGAEITSFGSPAAGSQVRYNSDFGAMRLTTAVTSNDDESGTILTSRVLFAAVAGMTYQISVDGYKGASGQISLAIESVNVPNDNFNNRIPLTASNITVTGSNNGASSELGEPRNAGVTGGKSVWWSWLAAASGTVSINTAGSTFDTTLGVYIGSSVATLTPIASNDDETTSILTSRVTFTAIAGQVYQISVDGYRGASGQISLTIASSSHVASSLSPTGSTIALVGSYSATTSVLNDQRNVVEERRHAVDEWMSMFHGLLDNSKQHAVGSPHIESNARRPTRNAKTAAWTSNLRGHAGNCTGATGMLATSPLPPRVCRANE